MLTIFSVPKAFKGRVGIIQRNAIQSWLQLDPKPEVVLFGNDEGVADICKEFALRHAPDVSTNEYGTPLLSDVFQSINQRAQNNLLCYVNADIILFQDLLSAAECVNLNQFLLFGRRHDIDVREPIDFGESHWRQALFSLVRSKAVLHPPRGSDFFLFPRSLDMGSIPPFAVGRPKWDQWFIDNAKKKGVPAIDVTPCVTILHQNHDYAHIADTIESDRNQELAGEVDSIVSGTHILTKAGIIPILKPLSHSYLRLHRWAAHSSVMKPIRTLLSRS